MIPISGLVALTDTDSPQWQAYEWLVYDDDKFVCPNDDTLVQRYILAVLYFATTGDAWDRCYRGDNECREEENAEPYLSTSSECEWYGSECFADGLIESVTLGKCGLILLLLLIEDLGFIHLNRLTSPPCSMIVPPLTDAQKTTT